MEFVLDIHSNGTIVIAMEISQVSDSAVGSLLDCSTGFIVFALAVSSETFSVTDDNKSIHGWLLALAVHIDNALDDQSKLHQLVLFSRGERSVNDIDVGVHDYIGRSTGREKFGLLKRLVGRFSFGF